MSTNRANRTSFCLIKSWLEKSTTDRRLQHTCRKSRWRKHKPCLDNLNIAASVLIVSRKSYDILPRKTDVASWVTCMPGTT